MKKIGRMDILDLSAYEKRRSQAQKEVIEIKKRRRVFLGDQVTLVFENRSTVISQIHEMMRAERIYEEAKILEEIEAYNELLPEDGSWSATLFIELTDPLRMVEDLNKYIGIDRGDALYLAVEDHKIYARFASGRSDGEKVSAVHYVSFPIIPSNKTTGLSRDFLTAFEKKDVRLVLSLPKVQVSTVLGVEIKAELMSEMR